MAKFSSPYNFVPLNSEVYYPDWADLVSHDIPFSDGEDGVIEVTFHNVSPLFTRNGSSDASHKTPFSSHIVEGDKKRYFIPGTSLKGMIRSTMEVLSFAKLTENQYTNRFYGYRDLGGGGTQDGNIYTKAMKNAKPGWLRKDKDERYYLTPCIGRAERIDDETIAQMCPDFVKAKTAWERNETLYKQFNRTYPHYENEDGDDYRIVCTGKINKKHNEFLFPANLDEEFEITGQQAIEAFYSVHEPSPDFDKISNHLDKGHELAVFFIPAGKQKVEAIGLASMFRYPRKQRIDDIINKQQKCDKSKLDLPETIFGCISRNGEQSLKGRVQFGNAFADKGLSDNELLPMVSGILGQPKASFYPYYLRQDLGSEYRTFDDAKEIAGRKFYRVHRGNISSDLPTGNGNKDVSTEFFPLPSDQTFRVKIAVHNLRKIEIGALLSALTLHNTQKVWHNIGMAKSFGFGKLSISEVSLKGFAHQIDDYLKAFEYEMSVFTNGAMPSKPMFADSEQVVNLMKILSEHDKDMVKVMSLTGYKDAKRKMYIKESKLSEENITVNVNSLLTKQEKDNIRKDSFIAVHAEWYKEAENYRTAKRFDDAINKYNVIRRELKMNGIDSTKENEILLALHDEQQEYEAQLKDDATAVKEKMIDELLSKGVGVYLDEKRDGKFKFCDYNTINKRTNQWLKKVDCKALNDHQKSEYATTFRRLYAPGNHPKKEDKDLKNPNSGIWKKAKEILGDRFDDLLGELIPK